MDKLKLTFIVLFSFFSLQAVSESLATQDYSFLDYSGESTNNLCVDQMLEDLSIKLEQDVIKYRIIDDNTSKKTKYSFPIKESARSAYKYTRGFKIELYNCNTTFTFYYELIDSKSCAHSDQFKKYINNIHIDSCIEAI